MNNIKIQKDHENAIIPTRGSEQAAGWDLYAATSATVNPGQTAIVNTGVRIAVPEGTFGGVFARSGLSIKQGLGLANGVGVVDSDYRGPVQVALYNHSQETKEVAAGDRIAQLVVIPYFKVDNLTEVDSLDETKRGEGKFGSTGK